jgi:carboxyl-terminal processing protease
MRPLIRWSGTRALAAVGSSLFGFAVIPAPAPAEAAIQAPPRTTETYEDLDPARRAYIAARLYAAIEKYFAHWDDAAELDFNAAFEEYLAEAMAAPDRRGFSFASLALMVRLNNSHTGFSDRTLYADAGTAHGFGVRHLGDEWVVISSERPGLRPGDVIVAVDGTPIDDFYAKVARYIPASTERYRERRLFYFWGRYLFPLQYTVTLADGRTVAIDRRGEAVNPVSLWQTEGRWLEPGRIAYIRVPSWNDPRFQEKALELLEEYEGADGLVIDVRRNNGGSTPVDFTSALMERPWYWWAESTPMDFALFSYYAERGRSGYGDFERPHMGWPATAQEPDSAFLGQIVILVDEGCHSACEDFTMPFKDNGRATIVGRATAGSSGQPYTTSFGDGMGVAVGAKREYFPDGSRFEGVGIEPDVPVEPTVEDLKAGRDVELEAALELMR